VAAALAGRIAQWSDGIIRTYRADGAGRAQTYRELWRRSGCIEAGLRNFCRYPGDTVVLLIEDAVDFAPAFWACIRGGFVAVPLMSAAREALHQRRGDALREALNRLSNINILADEKFAELAEVLRCDRGLPTISLDAAEAESGSHADGPAADPLCLVPSSGSTGRLKLVALRAGAVLNRNFTDQLRPEEHGLGTLALDSVSGQIGLFLRWGSWAHVPADVFTARPTSVLDAIEQHHISAVTLTSSQVKRIITAADQTNRKWKLDSLRRIGLGAETVVPKVMQRLAQFLMQHGVSSEIVRAGYGTTETGLLVNGANPLNDPIDDHGAVCLGSVTPGVGLRVVGSDGEVLTAGEIGEVQASCSQTIFESYWGEPEATRESFTADGWWRTGDLGRLRNGELFLHGRAKEVLIVSGKKLSLSAIDAEIETILAAGDRVFSCAVHWPGEAAEGLAVVFVAADAGAEHRAEIAENIRRFVARRFGFSPSSIIAAAFDAIPLAINGKLRRLELSARIRAGVIGAVDEFGYFRKPIPGNTPNEAADIEADLAEIWREALDIRGTLDRHANFFALGGDSLRSMMLYTNIEQKFGKQISAEAFFAAPTFAGLLRLVATGDGAPAAQANASDTGVPWPLPPVLRNKLLAHFETWDGHRPTRDRLVAGVNTDGAKTPLFWLFQDAVQFRQLAKSLGTSQPVYALRSGVNIVDYTEDNIQTLALRYVSEISEVAPQGPVFIGGACQGSIIALAVAQHLLRRWRDIPLLTLMEWGWAYQTYAGPVLLIHGRDSDFNPYRRYRDPDSSWRRAFAEHVSVETPGDHTNLFDDGYVEAWSEMLALHMRKAEQA
jgi:acyl-CoA synthetase (AMP-forming)/AMP-acid ligase II/acyl carrier protein